ncbi:MAG TPA: response regulator transcription factor [Sulfuricurvum sp.]|nr:response regulator transcription factor [Sulfuricurvum sp.]
MIRSKKVLIVDDDAQARQLVRKILKKLGFIKFLEAETGEEAIQIAREEHPNLVLMDIVMPGMDGYEACRQIKSDPLLQSTIVIFMTAVTMDEIDDKIIQAQGDDLLRKPLDASELYFRVKNYLTLTPAKEDAEAQKNQPTLTEPSHPCDKNAAIDLGEGFLYQPITKSLCKDNQYIPLMYQEILLLEVLIRHKNRIVSYDQLLDAITHNESESTVANLRTLIKLLRRKTYKELIKNLHSFGYRLVI